MFRTRFVAITGSVGKTTTKECLADILEDNYRVFRSLRNQNGSLMIPLNLLRVRPWHQVAVFEVATKGPGTLKKVARLLDPDIGVIVEVAPTHTRGYASIEETAQEKASLVNGLTRGSVAVVNGDNLLLPVHLSNCKIPVLRFGRGDVCELKIKNVGSCWPERLQFHASWNGQTKKVRSQFVGEHWIYPVSAAILTACHLGVDFDDAVRLVGLTRPFPARLQPVQLPSGATLLRDEYNASYCSVEAALAVLGNYRAGRRIAVLADCIDAEPRPRVRLSRLGRDAARVSDIVVFFGAHGKHGRKAALAEGVDEEHVYLFDEMTELIGFLKKELRASDLVLLKGQTYYQLPRVVFSLFGEISCRKKTCSKTLECDFCWELGASREVLQKVGSSVGGYRLKTQAQVKSEEESEGQCR